MELGDESEIFLREKMWTDFSVERGATSVLH